MNVDSIRFIAKVLIGSALISAAIKFFGPFLPLAPTVPTALILVLMPAVLMGLILGWRGYLQR